ncbi:MAG: efflux RND transporter periplasmic adaptor subunit [Alphaproteobacteria bacterium]|nr:efflux RND transporter periplasmic adaptor subunit [Alphaproteobacteria bacterium]
MSPHNDDNTRQSPIRRSYVVAGVIFFVLAVWVASGALNRKHDSAAIKSADAATGTAAKDKPGTETKSDPKASTKPTVRVRTITAEMRSQDLTIRGQTQALRKVQVRAETAGKVSAILADKGATVKAGDTICQINVDARTAMLNEARASMKQRSLEYDAAKTLQQKGFRSETSLAGDLAQFQAAKAQVERMEKELENTKLKAPFDGVVDDRMVDVGDYLSPGQPCAMVIDQDPFLVVGQVSEKNVGQINVGDKGWAKLITGQRVEGTVRFISKSSDPSTRTFRLELEVANKDGAIRDGVTAEIYVTSDTVEAHKISPAILTLNDRGEIGLRIVDEKRKAHFVVVKVIADDAGSIWVSGLPKQATIITVGQEYVTDGQDVTAVPDDSKAS